MLPAGGKRAKGGLFRGGGPLLSRPCRFSVVQDGFGHHFYGYQALSKPRGQSTLSIVAWRLGTSATTLPHRPIRGFDECLAI